MFAWIDWKSAGNVALGVLIGSLLASLVRYLLSPKGEKNEPSE